MFQVQQYHETRDDYLFCLMSNMVVELTHLRPGSDPTQPQGSQGSLELPSWALFLRVRSKIEKHCGLIPLRSRRIKSRLKLASK